MTQIIKIDADFFIFYLSQRHEGHKGVVFSKKHSLCPSCLCEKKITSAEIHENRVICVQK